MGLQLSGSVQLEGNLLVTGSVNSVFENVLVTGTLVAQEIETQLVSSSIIYSSGSNKFGDLVTDTQQFTGSLQVSGSSHNIVGNFGIGVTSTVGKLDIATGGNTNVVISNDSTDTGYNIVSLNGTRTKGSYAGIAGGGTGDDNLYLNSGNSVVIQTGGALSQRAIINTSGSVGIGVTPITDAYTLTGGGWQTVQFGKGGILGAYRTDNESMTGFNTYVPTDGTNKAIISDIGGAVIRYYADRITFNTLTTSGTTQTQTETMRVISGSVGIGTIPNAGTSAKLEVAGGNNLPPSTGTQNYTIALRDPTSMVVDVGGSILFQGYKTSTSAVGNFGYIAGKKENGTPGNEAGYLSFGTFDSSGIPTEAMRITSALNLSLVNGNLVIGTAGKGIDFSADGNAGGMTSELLDDYEEGTWTPSVEAITGTYTTVTNQRGTYTKIGRQVTVQFYFIVSDKGTGTVGARITNLPFTIKSSSAGDQYVGSMINTSTSVLSSVIAGQNTTTAEIYKYDVTDPITATQGNAGTLTYFV